MPTLHLGDCSNSCDVCALTCAEALHEGCIGTLAEQKRGDDLLKALDKRA